ncbi:MAG: malto-oligosyltrehalose trehalohydrolase [Gemmatimonadota bacterium]
MRLGATAHGSRTEFVVWAPYCETVAIEIVHPVQQRHTLEREADNYYSGRANVGEGARYFVRPDGKYNRPDPASRYQPDGVHGPSEVVAASFDWTDRDWQGLPLRDYIIYELHIGTFTAAGTFDAAIEGLDYLHDLGITAIELMPVAQFPGERNWGYDGVLPFAVQNSYGGPAGLKRLVTAAHARGVAVILDVVYNHLGPEGNYLGEFAPYFTSVYKTPWGAAINVDGEHSDGVRRYFIANALEWITDYHIDALRLDAVHGILDTSAQPFLAELTTAVHARVQLLGRDVRVIAESDLNDVRMIRPVQDGGLGMDAQWTDDFHHSLHALLTAENTGYYGDFGELHHFATSLRRGFVYAGDYSHYRKRHHGNLPDGTRAEQFVVCAQNHDQVGNRMLADRLSRIVGPEGLKLAAACVLLSPFIPLLFMGEEYGEQRPFPYFIDHSDTQLVESVRRGRKAEFAAFTWHGEPHDAQSEDTFAQARINPQRNELFELYRELIALRKQYRLGPGATEQRDVIELSEQNALLVLRPGCAVVFSFAEDARVVALPLPRGEWTKVFTSAGADSVPARISSPGSICIELPPTSALLLVSEADDA